MAEYYDMLRAANPQMQLPALSAEERQAFIEGARQFEERVKQIQDQRQAPGRAGVARRQGRGAAALAADFRNRTLRRESERNRVDEEARRRAEEASRRETAEIVQRLQRKQEQERLRKEEEKRSEERRIQTRIGNRQRWN